jgi:hypothetical protein
MPTISESELKWHATPCFACGQNEGAIWLCGEGMICEKCFSEEAGIPEEDAFVLEDELPQEARDAAKRSLAAKRIQDLAASETYNPERGD